MRIAVVGSGIAGLSCAHILGPHHDVVLFEALDRLGGHANTVDVLDDAAGTLGIDTGFIVHNDRNYPLLSRLFAELEVASIDTEMSFGVSDNDPDSPTFGLSYRATNLSTLFADRSTLRHRTMWRLLADVARFYRHANRFLTTGALPREAPPEHPDANDHVSTRSFLDRGGYGREFIDLHLIPMGASVWSADPTSFDEFPAKSLLRFLANHGLLGVGRRPQWRTVIGGSRQYVDAVADAFDGDIRLASPVTSVSRLDHGCVVRSQQPNGTGEMSERFDRVVLACHTDQSLDLLVDASVREKELLGAIRYQPNRATLHTDTSVLPANGRARAAWNYDRRGHHADHAGHLASLTYDLTTLQQLNGAERYLVTLNSDEIIDPQRIIRSFDYAHPIFDGPAIEAQRRLPDIDGVNGVNFCGAWRSYGFHEDGIASAVATCEQIGIRW